MTQKSFTLKTMILSGLILCLSIFSASAQEITRKTLELPPFHSIYVNSKHNVYLKQTNKQEVRVEVLADIWSASEVKVEDGVLHINMQKEDTKNKSVWAKIDNIKLNPKMDIFITVTDIKTVHINGGGKLICENSIAADMLDLAVHGPGKMEFDIKGKTVKSTITGSGSMMLKGFANSNDVLLAGSGSLNAFDLEVTKTNLKLTGSGNAEVNVSDELNAELYGSGNIFHKGNTKMLKKKEYGSGNFVRKY